MVSYVVSPTVGTGTIRYIEKFGIISIYTERLPVRDITIVEGDVLKAVNSTD